MTSEMRERLSQLHDELVSRYNDTEDPELLELIAALEIALFEAAPNEET